MVIFHTPQYEIFKAADEKKFLFL